MMIGFGELNEEFGSLPPYLISIEEVNEEGYANRVLLIDADSQASMSLSLGIQNPDELDITLATIMDKD